MKREYMGVQQSAQHSHSNTDNEDNTNVPTLSCAWFCCLRQVDSEQHLDSSAVCEKSGSTMMTEDIYDAVCSDNSEKLRSLLGIDGGQFIASQWDGHQIWPRRSRRLTPLQLAVSEGSTGCINLLISSGVDVNYGGPVCALVTAIEHRNLEMTSLLLDRGCDVNKRIVRGRLQHSDETCSWNPGGEMFTLPIDVALGENCLDLISKLLYHGADPTARYQLLESCTPLLRAKGTMATMLLLQATGVLNDIPRSLLIRSVHKMAAKRQVEPLGLIVEMGLSPSWIAPDSSVSLCEVAQTRSLLQENIAGPNLTHICRQRIRTTVWRHYRICSSNISKKTSAEVVSENITQESNQNNTCSASSECVEKDNIANTSTADDLGDTKYAMDNNEERTPCSCQVIYPYSFLALLNTLPLPCKVLDIVTYQSDIYRCPTSS